jgi:hypothetical protein
MDRVICLCKKQYEFTADAVPRIGRQPVSWFLPAPIRFDTKPLRAHIFFVLSTNPLAIVTFGLATQTRETIERTEIGWVIVIVNLTVS